MKITLLRITGWLLSLIGALIVLCSPKIVFPVLERALGIETIVDRANVIYFTTGGYAYTNPSAVMHWILSVAAIGGTVCAAGIFLLRQSRKEERRKSL
jgi:hypothetical protein